MWPKSDDYSIHKRGKINHVDDSIVRIVESVLVHIRFTEELVVAVDVDARCGFSVGALCVRLDHYGQWICFRRLNPFDTVTKRLL